MAQERREHQLPLDGGERHPDADSRPRAEGEPRVARTLRLGLGQEAIGVEALGIGPERRPSMKRPRAHDGDRAGVELAAIERRRNERLAREQRDGRIEAQSLLEDAQGQRQLRAVGERGLAGEGVHLALHRRVDGGVLREAVDGPRQPRGRRLVAGDEEREDLVAHLAIAHGVAALVLGGEQAREEIVLAAEAAAARVDHALHLPVERGDGSAELASLLPRHEHRRLEAVDHPAEPRCCLRGSTHSHRHHEPTRHEVGDREAARRVRRRPVQRHRQRIADLVGLGERVGVEKRLAGDAHREARGLLGERDGLPVAPHRLAARRARHHVRRVAFELRGVEERRHELPLAAPQITVGGEEPLARERVQGEAHHFRLLERARALDEQLLQDLGVVHDDRASPERLHARDALHLARDAAQEAEAIVAHRAHVAEHRLGAAHERQIVEAHAVQGRPTLPGGGPRLLCGPHLAGGREIRNPGPRTRRHRRATDEFRRKLGRILRM